MEDLFITCNDCGWCNRMLDYERYNCELEFHKESSWSFVTQTRRCRSYATPELAEEMKRIQTKAW